ncbi:MAG: thioesterase family protein [Acidobacteriota bacterium]
MPASGDSQGAGGAGGGGFTAIRHEVAVEVRYAETDAQGWVHHSNYLVWFELARTGLCSLGGHHYAEIEKLGYFLVVTRTETRHVTGARYGETVAVGCRIDRLTSRGVRFVYEVRRQDGQLLTSGATEHVWVDRASGRPCRTPEIVLEPFRRLAGREPPAPQEP